MKSRLLLLLLAGSLYAQAQSEALFAEIDPTIARLAEITGLKLKNKVGREFITRGKLKSFLQSRIGDQVSPENQRREELALKLFGFVPDDYNLKDSTVALLTEQAAAFYDYHKKTMFVLEGSPETSQQFVLVHELAHALADQNFRLAKYVGKSSNDDGASARQAVMEGQAQWLMYEYMARKAGQSLKDNPAMARMAARAGDSTGSEYPELASAPLYIRESLLFPYAQGMLFQQAVIEKLGEGAFAEVFRRPPASTQQILHPDLYLNHSMPTQVKLLPLEGRKNLKELVDGTLGEFDVSILLRAGLDKIAADTLADHWRGGSYRVYESKNGRKPLLQYAIAWSDPDSAAAFMDVYLEKILPAKWKDVRIGSETPGKSAQGAGRKGKFDVQQSGATVTILEGALDSAAR